MSQIIGDELLEQLQPHGRVKRREKVLPGQFVIIPSSPAEREGASHHVGTAAHHPRVKCFPVSSHVSVPQTAVPVTWRQWLSALWEDIWATIWRSRTSQKGLSPESDAAWQERCRSTCRDPLKDVFEKQYHEILTSNYIQSQNESNQLEIFRFLCFGVCWVLCCGQNTVDSGPALEGSPQTC